MRKLLIMVMVLMSFSIYSQEIVHLDTIELRGIRADKQTPITAKTITSKEIKLVYSGQELPVLLSLTPSVNSYTDGGHPQGYTYFRLRGIDQTRINMTLNGVPLNEPEDQGVYFSNYPNFAKNIKSVQIQRGVGTSTNGVSSFAGSMSFISPFGIKKKTELEVEYGSFNTSRVNFLYESGLSKNQKWTTFLNISAFNTDGYKYHSGNKGYSGFLGVGYYGDTETVKLTVFSGGSNNQMSWYGVSESDIKIDPRINYNHEDADDNFKQTLVMLEYKKRFDSKKNVSVTGFYNRLDGDWDLYDGVMLNFGLGSNFYGVISNFNYTPKDFNINIGVSGNMYNRNHLMVILPTIYDEIYNNTGYKNEISSYGKMEWNKKLFTLFADAQVRHVTFTYDGDVEMEKQDWTFFNPKVGVTFNVTDKTKLYGSVGKSNREPTRSDMFGGWDNLGDFTDVTPEEVVDFEGGVRFNTKNFRMDANLFYMNFENEITLLGAIGEDSLPLFGNVDTSYRSGIEVDLLYNFVQNFNLNYNGTFSKNEIQDGGKAFEPLYTPRVIQNLSVNYSKNKIFARVSLKNHSKSYIDFDNNNELDGFTTFGALVGYHLKKFTFKVQGMNLSNIDYYTNGYMYDGEKQLYVNAPISVYGTVTYKF